MQRVFSWILNRTLNQTRILLYWRYIFIHALIHQKDLGEHQNMRIPRCNLRCNLQSLSMICGYIRICVSPIHQNIHSVKDTAHKQGRGDTAHKTIRSSFPHGPVLEHQLRSSTRCPVLEHQLRSSTRGPVLEHRLRSSTRCPVLEHRLLSITPRSSTRASPPGYLVEHQHQEHRELGVPGDRYSDEMWTVPRSSRGIVNSYSSYRTRASPNGRAMVH